MDDAFVPNDREAKVANALGTLLAVVGLASLVATNITGSWWPVLVYLPLLLVVVVGVTAWAARTRHQSMWKTARQIARVRVKRRRS